MIRIVLIEDHELTRVGLRAALQQTERVEVAGEAANGKQGLAVLEAVKPDVAIVDIGLPDIDGIELLERFRQEHPESETKVLILTMHDNEEAVLAAFAAGADSYSMKDASLDRLLEAIRITHEGNTWIDPAIAQIVLRQVRKTPSLVASVAESTPSDTPISEREPRDEETTNIEGVNSEVQQIMESDPLTARELEILEQIVAGCNNAQIAEKLYITVGTVKTHVRSILNKLCVDDRTQAAVRALRSGLVN
ncbi:two-component response regulator [Geitlerinema sp. FC II]|uniref:response regulator n=1 Tax=Baaleninema simplex TaxID=2862350 RepID=UPI001FDFB631|nr:response regulator transcription factor [Baaleninema simplex]MDC0832021.1 response regulator transcription factor [Geitlerinema sp. CS-897]PPT06123.1 two-component response regulator [Geitlerinema sp. FC II]